MKNTLLFMFAILISTTAYNQDKSKSAKDHHIGPGLILNKEGNKKIFPIDHQLTLTLTQDRDIDCANCDFHFLTGYLRRVTDDSVTVSVEELSHHVNQDGKAIIESYRYRGAPNLPDELTVVKSDIYEIMNYKSKKADKRRETLGGFGALFGIIGIGTLISNFAVDGKQNRQNLVALGLTELGVGIVLGICSSTKKYDLSESWRID